MDIPKNKQTQSDVFLKVTEKKQVPDLELESIIDDQTEDNEQNYLSVNLDKDSKKETPNTISEHDLF